MNNDPNEIAEGWNPSEVTNEQVQTEEGWRLLQEQEIRDVIKRGCQTEVEGIEMWSDGGRIWYKAPFGNDKELTYRTKLTPEQLRQARGFSSDYEDDPLIQKALACFKEQPQAPVAGQTPEELQPYGYSFYPGERNLVKIHPNNPGADWYKRADVDKALAAKDEELKQFTAACIAEYKNAKALAVELCRAKADLAAERAKREEAEAWRKRAEDATAHFITARDEANAAADRMNADRKAAIQRAEQTEARLAELKAYDSKSTELYMAGVLEGQKTRDEQLAKANEQLKQAARAHTCVHHTDAEREKSGSCPVCANEQLRKVTEQMNAAVKSWRQGQEQLVAEAAKCEAMRKALSDMLANDGSRKVLNVMALSEARNRASIALEAEPHAALQRYGLEVARSAYIAGAVDSFGKLPDLSVREMWEQSHHLRSLTGQTDGKGEA